MHLNICTFPIWHRNVDEERKKQHSDNDMLMMIYLFWLDYFRNVSKFNFHHKIYKILPNWLAPQKVCPNSKGSSESYAPRLTIEIWINLLKLPDLNRFSDRKLCGQIERRNLCGIYSINKRLVEMLSDISHGIQWW